ncbi:MAG: dinitrogenase iron-molybdenum cofactor [PVC group bacterium]|nr:dinitrogenase iron-molybdenum cofactor [PVC group bacterium]
MRLGITLEDEKGMEGDVSLHFGQCKYFLIADIEDNKVKNWEVVANTAVHGGGGCVAVDEILKHNVTHVISGGMGMGAQNKFAQAGIKVAGYTGKVKDAIAAFLQDTIGRLNACREHGECS